MDEDSDSADPYEDISLVLAVEDERWERLGIGDLEAFARRMVAAAAAGAGLDPRTRSEIGVTLSDDAAVRELNAAWRGKDKPTNILSFPMQDLQPGEPPGPMLGDLILAAETVEREAASQNKSVSDHVGHLLVHGVLHLLGHDHIEDREAELMEHLETTVLAGLGIADPYAEEPETVTPRDSNERTEP